MTPRPLPHRQEQSHYPWHRNNHHHHRLRRRIPELLPKKNAPGCLLELVGVGSSLVVVVETFLMLLAVTSVVDR